MLLGGLSASGQVTWDADNAIGNAQDGSGTWNTSGTSWWNGTTDVTWPNLATSSAIFGAGSGAAGTVTVTGSVTTNGITFNAPGSGAYSLTSGTISLGGTTPTITANVNASISSILAGSAGLTKAGAGTLTLSGINTYSGTTAINAGTLLVGNASALPSAAALAVTSTGILDLGGYNVTTASLTAGTSTAKITNSAVGTGTLTISTFNTTVNTLIADGGANQKVAVVVGGTQATPSFANVNNTFSGGMTISSATGKTRLWIGTITTATNADGTIQSSNLGTGTVTIGTTTGAAQFTLLSTAGIKVYNPIVVNAASYIDGGLAAFAVYSPDAELYGQLTANQSPVSFSVAKSSTGAVTVFGQITGTNGLLLKTITGSAGTVTVTLANTSGNANNYQGATTVGATHILSLAASDQLPNGSSAGDVQVDGTLRFNGFAETINGLSGTGVLDGVSGTSTISIGDNSATSTFSGRIGNSGANAQVRLAKIGSGTLTLTGTNTFSGPASIAAGILSINGTSALQGTSGLTIAGGAGLNYTGGAAIFGKNVTVTAGSGTGTIMNSGGAELTLSGTLSKDNAVLRLTGGSFNVTGLITGTTAGKSDLFVDAASVTLSNTNTYNGPTCVFNSGTLSLGTNNAIPSTSAVTLGNAASVGTLALGTYTDSISQLVFSGSGGTLTLSGDKTAAVQLATAGSLALGANTSLVLTNAQTAATLYRLISATTISGSFAPGNVIGVPTKYSLLYTGTEVDLQMKANQATSFTLTPAASRVLVGGSTTLTGSLVNSSPAGAASLTWSPAVTGSLTGVSSSLGSVITAGGTSTITATLLAGNTAGSQNWSIVNADNNAITTSATSSGAISVVNQRTFTVDTPSINLGRFLITGSAAGSTTISSSGEYTTTANATLGSFVGTNTNGFSLGTTDATAFNGGGPGSQSANYRVSGSASSAGAIAGSFTSAVAAELGGIASITVALTGTAYDAASVRQNQSAAGNGGTISITNASGSYRSAASVASTSLTGHQGWSLTGFGTGSSAAAGATLAGTAHFNAAGLLSGTYTGLFTALLENDRTLGGATANDLGSLSWNLSEVVLNTTGSGQATLAANAFLNTVSLTSGTGAGATLASFAAGQIGASPSGVIMSFTSGSTGQYSDILHLQGTDGLTQVLQLSYDPSVLGSTKETSLIVGWLDTRTGSPTIGQWINSVLGNSGTNGVTMESPFLGSWANYVTATGKTADAALGAYGVDTTTHTVWAAINHNSQFAVIVPEPNTIIFAGIGIAWAGWSLWNRRRITRISRKKGTLSAPSRAHTSSGL